ncbi:hypothetical protein HAX54_002829 [Datura stramonium]|uniref:Uncharacterized protein n=1 Tax=Datura stramonium TaxID=4076 RepID=A0ABS8T4F8_DATST|nr:hypothetical protein [Datura stramonium]
MGSNESVFENGESDSEGSIVYDFLYPSKELLPDDKEMTLFDHLEELCLFRPLMFCLVSGYSGLLLGAPVSGYSGLLLGAPVILYEIIAIVLPGLTLSERTFLAPIVLGSLVLFYAGVVFSHSINILNS